MMFRTLYYDVTLQQSCGQALDAKGRERLNFACFAWPFRGLINRVLAGLTEAKYDAG